MTITKKNKSPPQKIIILNDILFSDILSIYYKDISSEEEKSNNEEIQETIIDFEKVDIGISDLLHEK